MKRRLLIKLGAIALLGLAGFVAYLWWMEPTSGISRGSVWRIRQGMTKDEVNSTIGMLPGDYSSYLDGKHQLGEDGPIIGKKGHERWTNMWYSDTGIIRVEFENAQVTNARYLPLIESALDKLLILLHLSESSRDGYTDFIN